MTKLTSERKKMISIAGMRSKYFTKAFTMLKKNEAINILIIPLLSVISK